MERRLWIGVLLMLCLGFFAGNAAAWGGSLTINATDNATIEITVSSKTMVDISPNRFSYTVDPGATCGRNISNEECNETRSNFYAVQIENIGSHNISYVWFNTTYPGTRPFGSGTNDTADAGNFVMLSSDENTEDFGFVNRVEYNETQVLVYVTDPVGNMPPDSSNYMYGRFRNNTNEYFWMVDPNGLSECDSGAGGGTTFYIGDGAHSKSSTGSVDFQACVGTLTTDPASPADENDCRSGALTNVVVGADSWGYADVKIGLDEYCVAVPKDCSIVAFSKWNKDHPFHLCGYSKYSWNTTADGYLVPGNSFAKMIGVSVPYGIHEGSVKDGLLTVIVSAQ